MVASVSRPRPHLQHYYFRQQQQRFSLRTRAPFRISQRLQSTLASGSTTPPPSDDDYIPFGPPIPTMNGRILASDDGRLSRLLPPPPPTPISTPLQASDLVYGYEPEVEILGVPEAEPESQAREAESKRTNELIRRKIEASWARRSAMHRSMAEAGLPIVGGSADLLEDARLALSQERATRGSEGAGEDSREVGHRNHWKLPSTRKEAKGKAKGKAKREAKRRKEEREQERKIKKLSPSEMNMKSKKMRRKEEGKWGASKVDLGNPMERRLEVKGGRVPRATEDKDESLEAEEREHRGEVKVQRTIIVGQSRIPVPVVKKSLPKPIKASVPSIREFIHGEKDPFDRKAFSRERSKTRKSARMGEEATQRQRSSLHNKVPEGSEWKQKRRKMAWELPPIEEVKKESKTDEWDARQKLQHYVATTPRSELEAWKVQKAALQKKFAMGWAPLKKLSPKARDWVKDLHSSVPDLTTKNLSEIFKVSPEAIRRILRANWTPSPGEVQDREQRWLKRREKIWERWIVTDQVQTTGMKPEVQNLNEEKKEKWLSERGEALERHFEKKFKDWKEESAMLDCARGPWKSPSFQAKPEPSDAGDVTAKERYARALREKVEKRGKREREYRERLRKAKSSETSTAPPTKLPTARPDRPPPRFL